MLESKYLNWWLLGTALLTGMISWVFLSPKSNPYAYPFAASLETRARTRTALFAQEIAFYQTRVNNNPSDGLDLVALAGAYLSKARVTGENAWFVLAEQAAQRSLAALPVYNSGAQLVLAEVLQAKHDFAAALTIIADVLKSEPRNASALALRSSIYLALGDLALAIQDANTIGSSLPSIGALVLKASILEAQNKVLEAEQVFAQALTLEDADDVFASARTRALFGRFWSRQGNLIKATQLLKESLRIAPNYPLAALHLAQLELKNKNWDKAKVHFQSLRGVQGSPSTYDHAALLGLAQVSTATAKADAAALWQEAIAQLRLEVKEGAFGHRRELAKALLERGQNTDLPEAYSNAKQELKIRHDTETKAVLKAVRLRCQETKTNCDTGQK
jgi:tetratricopeptide (TPR) repeat protein